MHKIVIYCLLLKAVDPPKSIRDRLNAREDSNGIINVWDDGNGSVSLSFCVNSKGYGSDLVPHCDDAYADKAVGLFLTGQGHIFQCSCLWWGTVRSRNC